VPVRVSFELLIRKKLAYDAIKVIRSFPISESGSPYHWRNKTWLHLSVLHIHSGNWCKAKVLFNGFFVAFPGETVRKGLQH